MLIVNINCSLCRGNSNDGNGNTFATKRQHILAASLKANRC